MSVELKVPEVGESIKEVQIGQWLKAEGDAAKKDENLVEIESDKATVELPAPISGVIAKVLKKQGEMAAVGEVIGYMEEASADGDGSAAAKTGDTATSDSKTAKAKSSGGAKPSKAEPEAKAPPEAKASQKPAAAVEAETRVMPAAARALAEKGLQPSDVTATGPGGRLLKEDVTKKSAPAAKTDLATTKPAPVKQQLSVPTSSAAGRQEELVPMSPIRRRIAERLVAAQQNAALLTTFNEIDMTEVMALRSKHRDMFLEKYGIKLGFMSFFVKATIDALKLVPQVNAEVRDPHVVYRNYYDIGIAVGGGKGLVVPILRNAEYLSFAEIELAINDFARRAGENKVKLEELQGGTFTISNGGVYGSLLSTPIVNPPQSGILGLHAIQDRPVARNGQVVIRPMMYIALTYDHRIVDGREAVTFLKRIKDAMEEPSRILLEV